MGHLFGEVSNSEREMQALLKQKESELRQTTSELEERSKLLLKAKVTIEQLSQELSSSRQEEHTTREDLHSAEDKLHQLEEQLSSRATTAKELQVLLLLLSLTTRLHVSGWLVAASQLLVTDHLASRPPPPFRLSCSRRRQPLSGCSTSSTWTPPACRLSCVSVTGAWRGLRRSWMLHGSRRRRWSGCCGRGKTRWGRQARNEGRRWSGCCGTQG